jgi:hypothetical protein
MVILFNTVSGARRVRMGQVHVKCRSQCEQILQAHFHYIQYSICINIILPVQLLTIKCGFALYQHSKHSILNSHLLNTISLTIEY